MWQCRGIDPGGHQGIRHVANLRASRAVLAGVLTVQLRVSMMREQRLAPEKVRPPLRLPDMIRERRLSPSQHARASNEGCRPLNMQGRPKVSLPFLHRCICTCFAHQTNMKRFDLIFNDHWPAPTRQNLSSTRHPSACSVCLHPNNNTCCQVLSEPHLVKAAMPRYVCMDPWPHPETKGSSPSLARIGIRAYRQSMRPAQLHARCMCSRAKQRDDSQQQGTL